MTGQMFSGTITKADALGYLSRMGDEIEVRIHCDYKASEAATEAFRRLSTCMESCGCTGYSPKADCPDPVCYCNTDR